MTLTADVRALLALTFASEHERERTNGPRGYFNSAEAAKFLGWGPDRFNRALTVLEKRGLLDVDESLGSAPFATYGFLLNEEGWLECERLGLPEGPFISDTSLPGQPAASAAAPHVALSADERMSLESVARFQFADEQAVPVAHVLLAGTPEHERDLRAAIAGLAEKGCIEIAGHPGYETLHLTMTGLMVSTFAKTADELVTKLLAFFRTRLSSEGLKFQRYTWAELKAAGVVRDDSEFVFAIQVFQLFRLYGSASLGKGPPPTANLGVPAHVVQLRAVASLDELYELLSALASTHQTSTQDGPMQPDPNKVFIIHGRNAAARLAVEHFLRALKLEPLDFDELAADMGTEFVGNIVMEGLRRARGIVVLFTPDEFAALAPAFRGKNDAETDVKRWQSRPNVIFEAGIAFGVARERSVLVTLGSEVTLFSDVAGIHLLRLANTVESRGKFRQKLIGMGCDVDQRTSAWTDPANAGNFEEGVQSDVAVRDPFDGGRSGSPTPPSNVGDDEALSLLKVWLRTRPAQSTSLTYAQVNGELPIEVPVETLRRVLPSAAVETGWTVAVHENIVALTYSQPAVRVRDFSRKMGDF